MPNTNWIFNLSGNFTPKIQQATTATQKLESAFVQTKTAAMSLGAAMGIAFGIGAVIQFGRAVVSAGTKIEDAKTGLTTLLGSALEAQKVIDSVMTEAQKTPFSFDSLLMANKALISTGLSAEKSFESIHNLSNAIAASGGSNDELSRMVVNMQQIKNVGKASALDIKQFAFAGVNIYKVLEKANIGYKKGMEVTFEQLDKALKIAAQKGGIYYHGLENMADNVSVKLSNVGDGLFKFFVHIFDVLKPYINKALEMVMRSITWLEKGFNKLVEVWVKVWDYTEDLRNALTELIATLYETYKMINSLAGDNGVGLLTYSFRLLNTVITPIVNLLNFLMEIVNSIITGIVKLKTAIVDLWDYVTGKSVTVGVDWSGSSSSWSKLEDQYGKKTLPKDITGGKEDNTELGTAAGAVAGSKSTNITLNITKLIEKLEISTTNLTESTTKIKEAVVKALLEGLNDAQVIAGQ